ncbi:MAG: hypothetical protein AAF702_26550 [Chloroflexota bacterium]
MAAPPTLKATEPRSALITGYDGPRQRALVVNDDSSNRQVLSEMLNLIGFDVSVAVDGHEAISRFRIENQH